MISICYPLIRVNSFFVDAVKSSLTQTHLPSQVIIVDQSKDASLKNILTPILSEASSSIEIIYIVSSISGLVFAKSIAVQHASSEILCFGEDDLIFPSNYFSVICEAFNANPSIHGFSGLVGNYSQSKLLAFKYKFYSLSSLLVDYRFLKLTDKQRKYSCLDFIFSDKIFGGASAWRLSSLRLVPFPCHLTLHFTEDVFFSHLINQYFGPNSTALLFNLKYLHFSSAPSLRYNIKIYKQKFYEEFKFVLTFSSSLRLTIFSLLLLLIARFLELVLMVPIKEKFLFAMSIVSSLLNCVLPDYVYRTQFDYKKILSHGESPYCVITLFPE